MSVRWCPVIVSVLGLLVFESALFVDGGTTSSFVRKYEKTIDMPVDSDVFTKSPGYNAPQQVHITQGDHVGKAMIVSWVTMEEPGSDTVVYWSEDNSSQNTTKGIITTYTYYDYTFGFIHHCNLTDLECSAGAEENKTANSTSILRLVVAMDEERIAGCCRGFWHKLFNMSFMVDHVLILDTCEGISTFPLFTSSWNPRKVNKILVFFIFFQNCLLSD
ncbi:purple acid phosphatase isoform X2 [Lactuca sativa]|uniref:purple acid phosphatase isoform X2 n=1 Tax=Lactuca sativa TaxID=4236 RepID=UPI001C69183A|nr:purple acid phosphatase isoform X2 [Lactuca sativa]